MDKEKPKLVFCSQHFNVYWGGKIQLP